MNVIHYKVDGEDQETTDKTLTPDQIMGKAGIDVTTHYLVELNEKGKQRESFQNRPNVEIHMHARMEFTTVYTGPMPVS